MRLKLFIYFTKGTFVILLCIVIFLQHGNVKEFFVMLTKRRELIGLQEDETRGKNSKITMRHFFHTQKTVPYFE
jgi:hypothetical protein